MGFFDNGGDTTGRAIGSLAGGLAFGPVGAAAGAMGGQNWAGPDGSGLTKYDPTNRLPNLNQWSQIPSSAIPQVNAPSMGGMSAPTVNMGGVGSVPIANVATTPAMNAAQLQGVGGNNAFRGGQLNAMNYLGGVASGATTAPGQLALNQAMGQNVANQFAMANSSGPNGQAAAMRNAQNNAGMLGAQTATQGSIIAGQERLGAAGQAGNIAGQGFGQDINVAGQNAGFQQGANATNYGGQLQTNLTNAGFAQQSGLTSFNANAQAANHNADLAAGFNDLTGKYAQMGMTAQQANQAAWNDLNKVNLGGMGMNNQSELSKFGAKQGFLGGALGGAGTTMAGIGSILSSGNKQQPTTQPTTQPTGGGPTGSTGGSGASSGGGGDGDTYTPMGGGNLVDPYGNTNQAAMSPGGQNPNQNNYLAMMNAAQGMRPPGPPLPGGFGGGWG